MLALLEQGLEDISITRSRLAWAIPFPLAARRPARSRARGCGSTRCRTTSRPPAFPTTGYDDALAGAAARHRQGHHAPARGDLAGDAAGRGARRCPSASGRTASCCSAASGSASRPACGSTSTKRSTATAPTRSAISCCAKCRSTPTARFSYERFDERYNADLANSLGNLASRAIAMVEKYCDGVVPAGARVELDRADAADLAEYHAAMDGSARIPAARRRCKRVMASRRARQRVRAGEPAVGARQGSGEARASSRSVLAAIMRQLARHAIHLAPFMPDEGAGALGADRRRRARATISASRDVDVARRHRMAGSKRGFVVSEAPVASTLSSVENHSPRYGLLRRRRCDARAARLRRRGGLREVDCRRTRCRAGASR